MTAPTHSPTSPRNTGLEAAALLLLTMVLGCGRAEESATAAAVAAPLSVEQWRQLPVEEKYDFATLERLKENDPKLQTDRGWKAFMKSTVVPERKKDLPDLAP